MIMMWLDNAIPTTKQRQQQLPTIVVDDGNGSILSESTSTTSTGNGGEEMPIWIRGEQRWVSGITGETTCLDVIQVLLHDEEARGRHMGAAQQYQITERWRGVEQTLEMQANILDIWTAWGTAQPEVKISLRRITRHHQERRRNHHHHHRYRSDSSTCSAAWKTIHPKRLLFSLKNNENEQSPPPAMTAASTDELLKLVLAQGEVIRRQLKKLRHNEHQIGCLEDKTHRARVRKHGSNYLLETYLKGLPEAVDPSADDDDHDDNLLLVAADKNSDSGVMTEGDSSERSQHQHHHHHHQTNTNKLLSSTKNQIDTSSLDERFSPLSSSEENHTNNKKKNNGVITKIDLPSSSPNNNEVVLITTTTDVEDAISSDETTIKEQLELFQMVTKLNKRLLREEECLIRLDVNLRKYEKHKVNNTHDLTKSLTCLRTEMAKSACEMQHNEIVLEETLDMLEGRRQYLDMLHKDLANEDEEYEMLQALMFSNNARYHQQNDLFDNDHHYNSTSNNSCINNNNIVNYQSSHHNIINNNNNNNTKEFLDTLV